MKDTSGLSDYHLGQLERFFRQGAKHHGWPNELWIADHVARLIRERFRINYHPEHVRKILKQRFGWTSQKPKRKARERIDKEVERWPGDELPRILRATFRRRAHGVFLNESGFPLMPSVRRTLVPRGQRPVLDWWDRRDRIVECVRRGSRRPWGRGVVALSMLDSVNCSPMVVPALSRSTFA